VRWQAARQGILPTSSDAEDHREDHEAVLVDQLVTRQCLNQLRAASNQNVATGLLLQPGHFIEDVAGQDRRVVPVGLLQRCRDDVLWHRVHPFGEANLVFDGRPGSSEALVRFAAEQLRVRIEQLIKLEFVALWTALESKMPNRRSESFRIRRGLP
jgi:hypothetical protein